MDSTLHPLKGVYKPSQLRGLYYGPNVVEQQLRSVLPTGSSKAFIITSNSLQTKTPLIELIEKTLTPKHHAGTFSGITEHAPITQIDQAASLVTQNQSIDTIISVGGGSPIDSAKAVVYRVYETTEKWFLHIAIPTTLSAAECTSIAGYTQIGGVKTLIVHPSLYPSYIFYDSRFGQYTPSNLFLSTGVRALDHAIESQYHPAVSWIPCRLIALGAIRELFRLLPQYKRNQTDEDLITSLFLAAYATLGFIGQNVNGGLGLSHSLGYALGSPYGIPHGITSCLTLGHVVKLKACESARAAESIAGIVPYLNGQRSGDHIKDSGWVGDRILNLVRDLGLATSLTELGVEKSQVDIICARVMGGRNSDMGKSMNENQSFQALRELVEGLY